MNAHALLTALALGGVVVLSGPLARADESPRLGGGYLNTQPSSSGRPSGNAGGYDRPAPANSVHGVQILDGGDRRPVLGEWRRNDQPPPPRPGWQDRPVPLPRPGYTSPDSTPNERPSRYRPAEPRQPGYGPPTQPEPGYGQRWPERRPGWGDHPQWRPGFEVPGVPAGFSRHWYRDRQYYYAEGYWYQPQGSRYVVTLPPSGVRVSALPTFAETLWVSGTTYYFAAGSYYRTDPGGGFVTVADPTVAAVGNTAVPTGAGYDGYDVTAYPLQGQTPERYAQDRYDCRRYAAADSGFDPERPGAVNDPYLSQRFRQALGACLAGRGYRIDG